VPRGRGDVTRAHSKHLDRCLTFSIAKPPVRAASETDIGGYRRKLVYARVTARRRNGRWRWRVKEGPLRPPLFAPANASGSSARPLFPSPRSQEQVYAAIWKGPRRRCDSRASVQVYDAGKVACTFMIRTSTSAAASARCGGHLNLYASGACCCRCRAHPISAIPTGLDDMPATIDACMPMVSFERGGSG